MKNKLIRKIFLTIFLLSLISNAYFIYNQINQIPAINTIAMAYSAQKSIACPCCGKNIAECTCGMAADMRKTVNSFTDELFKEHENKIQMQSIMLSAGKEFGMDTIIDEKLRKKLKAELIASVPENRPQITIEPADFDFGRVYLDKGVVQHSFALKNVGSEPLLIKNLETSCGCTSAKVIYKNEESPVFGMHTKNDWMVSVAPGDEAKVVVMYDPNHHPDFVGDATRTITISSNDPIDSKKEIKITLTQRKR